MKKTALVLSGGGSRGGYEIGVWKALCELNVKTDMVMGASVGAINGAMIAQGDPELCEKLWQQLETDMVFDIDEASEKREDVDNGENSHEADPFKSLAASINEKLQQIDIGGMPAHDALAYGREIVLHGGAGNSGLRGLLKKYIDEDKVRASSMEYGLVATEFPSFEGRFLYKEDIPKGRLTDYILASASCFPAVCKCIIDGKKFIDGGYRDNLPVEMAMKKGASSIIAVDLHAAGFVRKDTIENARRESEEFRLLESPFGLGNFLIFDKANASRIMRLGYLETMKAWGKYDGNKYIFKKGVFTSHQLKGAENAADILRLNPACVYDKNTLRKALTENLSKVTPLFTHGSASPPNIEKLMIHIKDDLSRFKIRPQLLLFIAKSLMEDAENSIFIQPAVFKLLEEEIQAANFLINERCV